MNFVGEHNDKLVGFYRSSYIDKATNAKKYMVVTQFEPTDARRAFPCWDEPAVKATFDVELVVKKELTALSNMNQISETVKGDVKHVKFEKTPIMSTYLVAFAVGQFDYIEAYTAKNHNNRKIQCRVYTIPGSVEYGRFALEACSKMLDYYANVFGIDYPLPKLDMLAVPDFDAGAMENWGLITYRTVRLLYDEKNSSAKAKKDIAYVVGHELAHQWFGNLVTMEWWSELWLNEGFATWVGWLAVDHFYPELDIWTGFVAESLGSGLALDSLRSSHPIQVDISSSAEVRQIFDAISYHKGASVIRMLSSYLGQDVFLKGIKAYLKRHAYGNASTEDLWKALSEESGQDVLKFMHLWTRFVGYPVLRVTEEDQMVRVRQSRFLTSGDPKPEEDQTIWWVPIIVATEQGEYEHEGNRIAQLSSREFCYKKPCGVKFWKLNSGQSGVYRVHYPEHVLRNLGQAVKDGLMKNNADRIGLVSDTFNLARSGIASTAALLELLSCYENETEHMVWLQVAAAVDAISSVWFEEAKETLDGLNNFKRKIYAPLAHKMGWEFPDKEDSLVSQLRAHMIEKAGLAGDEETLKEAKRRFKLFVEGDTDCLHPNVRSGVFLMMVHHGEEQEWESVRDLYEKTETEDQKMLLLAALGGTKHLKLIKRTLEYGFNDKVRSQDVFRLYNALGTNGCARYELWSFFQAHWDEFETRYKGSLGIFSHIINSSCSGFSSDKMAQEVEAFFNGLGEKRTKFVERPLNQSLERIRANSKWLNSARQQVAEWAASQLT